jgi:sterol desaturase/sphingolipid hydroxylase (fatty acid hydroxylase superfamily)
METILPILMPVTFLLALALERLFPSRDLPKVRGWILKGVLFFFLSGAINVAVPALVAILVARVSTLHLEGLGLAGAIVVVVASEVIAYVVHRTLHRVPFLWRWSHQMHHSAERMDVAGAFYFHPFDIALQTGLATALIALLGVTPDAAALAGFVFFALGIFQHLNVKTPRWLGYLVIRPEQHAIHHGRDVHAYNYGNFAFMDLLCGTLRNPASYAGEHGFWDGASKRTFAMLVGRDVARA